MLASEILSQMNRRKSQMFAFLVKNKNKTVGVIHIHDLLSNLK